MAGTSAEFTGKVGSHSVQRTPGSDLPSALNCIDPAPYQWFGGALARHNMHQVLTFASGASVILRSAAKDPNPSCPHSNA